MEELRSSWAKMCNELYEEKGLTERVDARSYEERGIDKIPMVHEAVSYTHLDVYKRQQYKQVGNAVPVNLAYEIGLEIHKSLEGVK